MSASSAERSLELSPAATVGLLLLFFASGGLGYVWAGIGGAFFAALGVTTTVAIAGFVRKVRAQDRTRMVGSSQDLAGLAPAQALSVMGAMTGTAAPASFKSELLTALEAIDETLKDAPVSALEALEPLLEKHPRSPAVHLRHARALQANDDEGAAYQAVAAALRYAIDGGMNPMAVGIFVEFAHARDRITLEDRHLRVLTKALEQRGHAEEARLCATRTQ